MGKFGAFFSWRGPAQQANPKDPRTPRETTSPKKIKIKKKVTGARALTWLRHTTRASCGHACDLEPAIGNRRSGTPDGLPGLIALAALPLSLGSHSLFFFLLRPPSFWDLGAPPAETIVAPLFFCPQNFPGS